MLMVSRFLILGFSEIPWGFVLLLKNVYRRRALKSRSDLSETPLVYRNLSACGEKVLTLAKSRGS